MKKVMLIWIVFIMVVLLTGLVRADVDEVAALRAELAKAKDEIHDLKYGNVPPIEQQIKPAPDFWKGAYGDTQETQLYFNSRTAMLEIEQCKGAIRLIAATINTITDPADPNSLASRIVVLEEKVADMPVIEAALVDEAIHALRFREGGRNGWAYKICPTCLDDGDILGDVPKDWYCSEHEPIALKPDDPKEVAE